MHCRIASHHYPPDVDCQLPSVVMGWDAIAAAAAVELYRFWSISTELLANPEVPRDFPETGWDCGALACVSSCATVFIRASFGIFKRPGEEAEGVSIVVTVCWGLKPSEDVSV